MFGLGPATKIFVALEAVDMRKGFKGLFGLVRDHLLQDPLNGNLYLFANRSHTRLKAPVYPIVYYQDAAAEVATGRRPVQDSQVTEASL